ncbi:MAG: response regulator transcription factor [Acidobacteria bacterium]|nr:response regulator transcription factor [Acidobacteriota bacterium]
MPIRILIADDHTLMRQGLHEICTSIGGFDVVGEARTGAEAVALRAVTRPDVVLMDLAMPEMDGAEAIRRIVAEAPTARIIALTMYRDESYMLAAIRGGARAYLLKTVDAAELIAAIEAVHRGEYLVDPIIAARVLGELHLTPKDLPKFQRLLEKEIEVLRLVAKGLDNREIADALDWSVHTVSNRLRVIFEKLHVTNRTQAALYALRQGWATLDERPD